MKEALIAYRIYRPSGDRHDQDDKPYFGWINRYDEWICIHSPRLLPKSSISSETYDIRNSSMNETFSDSNDLIFSEAHVPPSSQLFHPSGL